MQIDLVAPRGEQLRRRTVLRSAVHVASAVVGGALMSACAGLSAPAPESIAEKVILIWSPWRVGWGSGWEALFYEATAPFRAAHPGVDIRVDVSTGTGSGNYTGVAAQIIAGSGPDVYSGFTPTPMIEGGYNLNLLPYLKLHAVDTTLFDAGQYAKYVSESGEVFALPAELSTSAVPVNLGVLDALGLPYPDPEWTYQQAATLWSATTVRSTAPGKRRYGFQFWGQKARGLPGDYYLRGWGASAAMRNYSAHCGLSTPEALTFAQWWYPLVVDGVMMQGGSPLTFTNQQSVSGFAGSWQLPTYAGLRSFKWDFWPQPRWPTGTSSYAGNDYYAVNANTRHPTEAAAFIVWLTTSTDWQRAMMRLQLVIPPTRPFWAEWVDFVRSVAPPLASKRLEAFMVAPMAGRAFNHPAFAYDSNDAYAVIGTYTSQIVAGKLDAVAGFREAARAVDAFETAARTQTPPPSLNARIAAESALRKRVAAMLAAGASR